MIRHLVVCPLPLAPDMKAGDAYFLSGDPANSIIGAMFSTPDRDQDSSPSHCAETMQSGWWFSGCGITNPTGRWVQTPDTKRDTSMPPAIWWGVPGFGDKAVSRVDIKIYAKNV